MPFKFRWSTCLLALVISAAPAGAQSLVEPQSPVTVTLPDGSLLSDATNQVLVFLKVDATGADVAAIRSMISSAGGQVVGESAPLGMLQVEVANPANVGTLMVRVMGLTGVQHVGINLFLRELAGSCSDATPWIPAAHVGPAPDSAGDVIMIVVDGFETVNGVPAFPPPPPYHHGDIVAAVAVDAGGVNAAGRPLFEIGRNLREVQVGRTLAITADRVAAEVARHPNKKIVINYSGGPSQCDGGRHPNLDSRNEADRAAARAACVKADKEFYSSFNNGVMRRLRESTRGNVVWVNAAANMDVSLENASSISGCDFIPVGGMDGSRLAAFTEVSAAIPVYQQACNVAPRSLKDAIGNGNSFAAPFVAAQLAANWARHPNLNGCTVGNLVTSLPPIATGETGAVFDPVMIAAVAEAPPPGIPNVPLPMGTLACGAVTIAPATVIGTVNQTVRLAATAAAGGSTFEFQSSNPEVANVDRVTGAVTIRKTGVATISAKRAGSTCSGEATVMAPSENYRGTFSMQMTMSMPQDGWTPNPLIISGSTPSAPMQLGVLPSLTAAGVFTAAMTMGPGSISVSIPASTCTSCDPQITVPGMTQSDSLPSSGGTLAGVSDQRLLRIPIPGLPPITGTVSVLASTVQVTLNWTYQTVIAGGPLTMTLNATLTRQ